MCGSSSDVKARSAGFTMIELITIIIILGILAAVAIPKMTALSDFRALEFHDQTVSALRHAQKTATSHRRMVCVAFTASTVTLTIDTDNNAACDTALLIPGAQNNQVVSGDTTNAIITASTPAIPATINFQSDGSASDASITISGQTPITITGATGSVR